MKFKYKFTTTVYVLFALMYLLGGICFAWNLIRLINSLSSQVAMDTYKIISAVLCIALPIILAVFITAMIISSQYIITEESLSVKFGFIGDKYKISDISSIVKNLKTDKLTVVFKDESELKIQIDKNSFDDFSSFLMKTNKGISYGESAEDDAKGGK